MDIKQCTKCKGVKPLSQFSKQKTGKFGVTSRCKECVKEYKREHYASNPQVVETRRQYFKDYRLSIKQQVFDHYGAICVCCGEAESMFLTLDHINNDGAEHKRMISPSNPRGASADKVWRWVIQNGFPADFQILCYNCNCGKRDNGGTCPHQAKD